MLRKKSDKVVSSLKHMDRQIMCSEPMTTGLIVVEEVEMLVGVSWLPMQLIKAP